MIRTKARSKKLALLLVLAMVMTMFVGIGSVGAASTNSIDRVPTVADDYTFTLADAPQLRIEEKNIGEFDVAPFSFRLNLTNAEWTDEILGDWPQGDFDINVARRSSTSVTVSVETLAAGAVKRIISIPLISELQGTGEARVTIDDLGSVVSSGTFTFAIGAKGETIATVDEKETVQRGRDQQGATIIIDEATAGALSEREHTFRVRLPRDIEWEAYMDGEITLTDNLDGDITDVRIENNNRDLIVTFDIENASTVRGSIIIEPFINVTRDASYGEIAVSITSIRGDVTGETGLVIAEYKDYGIEVSIEEVEEFFAGRLDDEYITAEIEIKETIANSLFTGRVIDFELPSWVAIADDFVIQNDRAANQTITTDRDELDDNTFEYTVPESDEKMTITMEIPLTIEANAGDKDIPLVISGAGIDTTELVIARSVAPVSIEVGTQARPFELGVQRQDAPEITITESMAGAIRGETDANRLRVFVRDAFADSMRVDSFDYEVVSGDISIKDTPLTQMLDGSAMIFTIDGESDVASTIRIYNIKMTLDRTVPQGPFRLDIGGNSLVDNNTDENGWVNRVVRFDYVEVGTPSPGVEVTAVFTIGSTTYKVNGEERVMDVAPYIMDARTFLPVRFTAEALGLTEDNIIWDANTKTVTVLKGDRIVQMQIGSRVLFINGAQIMMDTAPEIRDGRTMLPIRWVAQAMGVSIEWDGDARTVTVTGS